MRCLQRSSFFLLYSAILTTSQLGQRVTCSPMLHWCNVPQMGPCNFRHGSLLRSHMQFIFMIQTLSRDMIYAHYPLETDGASMYFQLPYRTSASKAFVYSTLSKPYDHRSAIQTSILNVTLWHTHHHPKNMRIFEKHTQQKYKGTPFTDRPTKLVYPYYC